MRCPITRSIPKLDTRMPLSGENEIELSIEVQADGWQEDRELVVAPATGLAR